MTSNEFNRIKSILKGSFPRLTMFDTPDSQNVVFNAMNRFDSRDVMNGVKTCVEECQYPPSLKEILNFIERAAEIRKDDERRIANAHQTFEEAVKCPKCNDAGFLIVTYRKPARDPKYCREDDPYDYTETVRPCTCGVARQKFPTAFMSDEEWQRFVEDQRRKGKGQSSERPGMHPDYYEKECGEVYNIRPGRRPQVFTKEKG